MNVLTRTLRHLTVDECKAVATLRFSILCEQAISDFDVKPLSDQPAIIQEWYSEWLRDDHYPLSPVDKDHADELWQKFCEEVGR